MFVHNEFYTEYQKLILNNIETGGEVHHIKPRSLGGTNDKDNLVRLSLQDHYKAHLLLAMFTKSGDKDKMLWALWRMSNREGVITTPEEYATTKHDIQRLASRHTKRFFASDEGKKQAQKYSSNYKGEQSEWYASKWMTDGTSNVRVKPDFFDEYLVLDWKYGRSNVSKGGQWITYNNKKKRVRDEKILLAYLIDGWVFGSGDDVSTKNYIRIHKNDKNKSIHKNLLADFITNGWEVGTYKMRCKKCSAVVSSLGWHNHKCHGKSIKTDFEIINKATK